MIRNTLEATNLATYSVDLPRATLKGMPGATGTGFFVSADGWFVTAAHVVTENGKSDGPVRSDVGQGWLMKERGPEGFIAGMCQGIEVDYVDPTTDFALLKLDFQANANKESLKGRTGFPYITVSRRALEEGEPVYAFGYPLSRPVLLVSDPVM